MEAYNKRFKVTHTHTVPYGTPKEVEVQTRRRGGERFDRAAEFFKSEIRN